MRIKTNRIDVYYEHEGEEYLASAIPTDDGGCRVELYIPELVSTEPIHVSNQHVFKVPVTRAALREYLRTTGELPSDHGVTA